MISLAWIGVAVWQTRKQTVMSTWAWLSLSLVLGVVLSVVIPILGALI